jgi:hypothetical protein
VGGAGAGHNKNKDCMNTVRNRLLGACLWLLGACACHAQGDGAGQVNDSFMLKGFGTVGLARSDTNSAEYVRDLSQPHGLTKHWSSEVDSLLGVQANLKLGAQTEGVVQLISRYRYDGSYDPEVAWAFLRHDFTPDFQVRAGRLGTEFYMLADSRLIGYANLTVRPPADFYGPLVFSYFDGFDTSWSTSVGDGLLRAKFFAGISPESTPFVDPITWDLKGTRLIGGHLDYFQGPWQFRIATADVKFNNELPLDALAGFPITTLIPELSIKDKAAKFHSLGVVYDKGPLQIQAMLGRIDYESSAYEDSKAGFITGAYRFGQFTPYLGYSKVKSSASSIKTNLPGPFGPAIVDFARTLTTATHADQHTITLGTRWDVYQNLALKFQLDAIRGKPESVFPFRGDTVQWDGSMNVMSVTLDFAF